MRFRIQRVTGQSRGLLTFQRIIRQFSLENNLRIVLAKEQNFYPDISLLT